MKTKVGILGALSVIAVGVSIGGVASTPVLAQNVANVGYLLDTSQMDPELVKACEPILATRTVREFKGLALAWNAYNDPNDKCYEIARAQYALLTDDQATGAIAPEDGGGYTFAG